MARKGRKGYFRRVQGGVIKVAIVGPESSGKSTLCAALAQHYGEPRVDEYARHYLGPLGRPYAGPDLLAIAQGQAAREDAATDARRVLLCDTDMITVRIWGQEKFGHCDPALIALSAQRHYDHWLLCRPDIPWEADPLRENPHDRDRLFLVYQAMLRQLGRPLTIMEGGHHHRMRTAVDVIDRLLAGRMT